MIRDYYERQILESEAADAEGEPEDDDGDDEFMEVDVDASEVEQVLPVRIVSSTSIITTEQRETAASFVCG